MLLSEVYPEASLKWKRFGLLLSAGFWFTLAILAFVAYAHSIVWVLFFSLFASSARWYIRLRKEHMLKKAIEAADNENRQITAVATFLGRAMDTEQIMEVAKEVEKDQPKCSPSERKVSDNSVSEE